MVRDTFPGRVSEAVIPAAEPPVINEHSTLIGGWRVQVESGKVARNAREDVRRFIRDPEKFELTSN